ncbi:NADPH-dependent FMN reductase [Planomonospora corallina]|uniref:NADPH-dependent FMN reductase n=1 Tax=Planomonospora corallina TaxID=1806052 RepID=A0ABV8IEE6_9ACTN
MPITPHVTVLSGALNAGSRTERLARWCAREFRARGASATLFRGAELDFPFYPGTGRHGPGVVRFLDDLVRADGVVLVTPSYHGSVSGLLKNALDYVNELAADERPFFDGRAVGCVALAGGEQGAAATLATMRAIVHALRGWPTPLGVGVAGDSLPDGDVSPGVERTRRQLGLMLDQVLSRSAAPVPGGPERGEPVRPAQVPRSPQVRGETLAALAGPQ